MSIGLSSVQQINDTVKFDSHGFSFADTVGQSINNARYSEGYSQFQDGYDSSKAFLYKALSAIGNDIGETVYTNIRDYVSFVSDVDLCKIKALKSMLQMYGYRYTLFDNLAKLPRELLNLMDVLSINRKHLIKSGILTESMLSSLRYTDGVIDPPVYDADKEIDFKKFFAQNAYYISADTGCVCSERIKIKKLNQTYLQLSSKSDYYVSPNNYRLVDVHDLSDSEFPSEAGLVLSADSVPVFAFPFDFGVMSADNEIKTVCVSDLIQLDPNDNFIELNSKCSIDVSFYNTSFDEDTRCIDDESYENYLAGLYSVFLKSKITARYNTHYFKNGKENTVYVYPYLGNMYYDDQIAESNFSYGYGVDDSILSVKTFNHISKAFNEQKIVDAIDDGRDSYDNYSGAELCVLLMERDRRADFVSPDKVPGSRNSTRMNQTRYSYYIERDVADYAKFIDACFGSISGDISHPIYDFDANFYVINSNGIRHVISQRVSPVNPDPAYDIDQPMIDLVAQYLAQLTLYISKIREKLKFQTRKNYMKGTNLLLTYIVNEYLNEYAQNNRPLFETKDAEGNTPLTSVYEKLDGHQFGNDQGQYNINVDEYYDKTEYYNISTDTSVSSGHADNVNPRFWQRKNSTGGTVMDQDGLEFSRSDIEQFYLKTFNISAGVSSDITAFLSRLYDLGANDSYLYDVSEDGSIRVFSARLSNNVQTSEIYKRLVAVSSDYADFRSNIDYATYVYPAADVSDQLSDVCENHIRGNLSAAHLLSVAALRDKFMPDVVNLCNDVNLLEVDYNQFISGEYSFYYNKSEIMYSYQDHDIDSGAYLHDYYIGNSKYILDDSMLYDRLHSLDQYSTEANIRNWGLIDRVEYVKDEFNSIYGHIRADVISELTKTYGFVDINAETIDDELKYTYDFLNDQITTRKQFLTSQLMSLQQQASALKLQYDNLNNTFSTAVASYNDGHPGYSLGDTVYAVTLREYSSDVWSGGRCKRASSRPAAKKISSWVIPVYDESESKTYWYYPDDDGRFCYKEQPTSYDSDASLTERCTALHDYMNCYTTFLLDSAGTVIPESYGLKDDGIESMIGNIERGLQDVKQSYDEILDLSKELFGVKPDQSADDYQNIISLIKVLTTVDQTKFSEDTQVLTYTNFLKIVLSLSSDYIPVKSAYESIFKDSQQSLYLSEFGGQGDLTQNVLNDLTRYYLNRDRSNYEKIRGSIYDFIGVRFASLIDRKSAIEQSVSDSGIPISFTAGNMIEQHLERLSAALDDDAERKRIAAYQLIDEKMYEIYGYVATMSSEISSKMSSWRNFDDLMTEQLSELNFFENQTYKDYKQMFLTYGGQDICYDPYYNIKNKVHSSYQIHPFLWNFVKKIRWQELIDSGFKSKAVEELEDETNAAKLGMFIGEFGQTVNTWKNYNRGMVDFSGYTTRYEKSDNKDRTTGIFCEVVDYDGGFYPPAVEEYLSMNADRAKYVVSNAVTRHDVICDVSDSVSDDMTDYIVMSENGSIDAVATADNIRIAVSSVIDRTYAFTDYSNAIYKYIAGCDSPETVSKAGVIAALQSVLPQTFYEKYYKHLGLPRSQLSYIADQLFEHYGDISAVAVVSDCSNVYDIYKYGLDSYGNSYLLYKQYEDTPEQNLASFKQRRDTLGRMWIRLAGHPIAFPAFTGSKPQYHIGEHGLSSPLLKLAKAEPGGLEYSDSDHQTITRIVSKMKYFYDFELSQDGNSISYVVYNGDLPGTNPFFKKFELGWVAFDQVRYVYERNSDLEYLEFDSQSDSPVDYIDFNLKNGMHLFAPFAPTGDLTDENMSLSGVRYPALVGYYPHDTTKFDFAYVYKVYSLSADKYNVRIANGDAYDFEDETAEKPSPEVSAFVVEIDHGTNVKAVPSSGPLEINAPFQNGRIAVGDSACVGYDKNRASTTFAFTTVNISDLDLVFKTETATSEIDFGENTEGATIDDPLSPEMNSHDVFKQNITFITYNRKRQSLAYLESRDYNLNADLSYIPQYPGLSGESYLYKRYAGDGLYRIELLGMSKDFEQNIRRVNPNPDPYFDYESVSENTVFGRVYENYVKNEDMTFTLIANPTLNPVMPPTDGSSSPKYSAISTSNGFILTYNLKNIKKFTDKSLSRMEILIYNRDSLGKNPYYIGTLESLIGGRTMNYNEASPETEAETDVMTDLSAGQSVKIVGTYDKPQTKSRRDTNHIDGIGKFFVEYGKQDSILTLSFVRDGTKPSEYDFIPEGEIMILLYDKKNLDQFKYYHMLDAHGAINCRYFVENKDHPDEKHDGWTVHYNQDKYGHDDLSDLTRSFYYDESGRLKWLSDIELSDYDYLSDIYVLAGNTKLGFKYDEQLRFDISSDMYYYPTLNMSYPKTAAQSIDSDSSFNNESIDQLSDVFTQYNTFTMTLDDPVSVADLGDIDIDVLYDDTEDLRAYEDYLGSDSTGFDNYQKYDSYDPRIFEYLKFQNVQSETSVDMPQDEYEQKSIDTAAKWLSDRGFIPSTSEDVRSGAYRKTKRVTVKSSSVDLSKQLKLHVNYRRLKDENNALELFFNYYNYLNTPYVKIEDGIKLKSDIIPGTYLRLKPGENGILDIVVQFRYYVGDQLYGYRNARILSYKVFNVSDDKPKFVIRKIFQAAKDSLLRSVETGTVTLKPAPVIVDVGSPDISNSVTAYISISSDKHLSDRGSFYFDYPNQIMDFDEESPSVGYIASRVSPGLLKVTVTNSNLGSYAFNFNFTHDITSKAGRKFILDVSDAEFYDNAGRRCLVNYETSGISIVKNSMDFLAETRDGILDYLAGARRKTAIVVG